MKILSAKELTKQIGLSRTTIWRMERRGEFPQRIVLSSNRVGWDAKEINDWLESRPRIKGGADE